MTKKMGLFLIDEDGKLIDHKEIFTVHREIFTVNDLKSFRYLYFMAAVALMFANLNIFDFMRSMGYFQYVSQILGLFIALECACVGLRLRKMINRIKEEENKL